MSNIGIIRKRTLFSPTSIAGCQVWFDAADTATMGFSGTSVNTWTSKGTPSLTATYSGTAPTYTTINTYPALSFNGSSTKMTTGTIASYGAAGTTWITAAINLTAVTSNTPVDASAILATNGPPERSIRFSMNTANTCYAIHTGYLRGDINNNTNGVRGFIDTPTSFNSYTNGSTFYTNNTSITWQTATNTSFILGQWNTGYLNGYIFECVAYDGILTLSQYQQVEGYLATKWGFRNLLPQGHPGVTTIIYPLARKPMMLPRPYYTQFSPTNIAGCQLWLDGADSTAASMTFSSGSNLSSWKDKSGYSNHFSSNAVATTNINDGGYSVVNFTSGAIMTSVNTVTFTTTSAFFVVSKNTDFGSNVVSGPSAFSYIFAFPNIVNSGQTTGDLTIRLFSGVLKGTQASSGNDQDLATNNYYVNGNFNPNYGSNYYYGVYSIIGAVNLIQGGTSVISLSSSAFANPTRYFVGNIAEFIYYPAGVSPTQRQQIESYLSQKWGLTIPKQSFSAPTTIPGCQLWLDGADPAGTGVAPANSASLSTWVDKSGNSRNATPSSGRIAGTFSSASNCVYFGSSSVGYQTSYSANPTNETMFIVASINSPANINNNTIIGGQYGARSFGFGYSGAPSSGTGYSSYLNNEVVWQSSSIAGPPTGTTALITGTVTTTTSVAVALNGSNFTTGSISAWSSGTTTYLGVDTTTTAYYYVGYIMEILFYNSVLNSTQRQQIEGYLATKWGLQSQLPSTHTYYLAKYNHLNNNTPAGTPALVAQVYGQVQRNSFPLFPTTGTNYTSSTNGIYTVLTFAYPGGTLVVNRSITATYLVVGGGGGGGNSGYAGGGGAGGAVYISTPTVLSPGSYTVTVGVGGALGTNGGNSVFNGTTGTGGGYGSAGGSGGNGGCGGGGEGTSGSGGGTGSQGYNGSAGYTQYVGGGGGGGMGQAGSTSRSNVGNGASYVNGYGGGNGITNSITGSSVYYAGGGGGGGGISVSGGGPGGLGGGGNGAGWYAATQGTNGLGGGGGAGAIGGHGTVIISYLL